jgi:hypothetical protein
VDDAKRRVAGEGWFLVEEQVALVAASALLAPKGSSGARGFAQDARSLMPLKKSESCSSIRKSCDELRGGMDAAQDEDHVLVLLFVQYVSERYAGSSTRRPRCRGSSPG